MAQQGNQNKDRPQTVNHAGNGGQQLGKERQKSAQPGGAHLSQENGDAYGQGHGDNQRQDRGHHGAIDKRQRAKIAVHRIPRGPEKERHAEFLNRELRTRNELDQDQEDNSKNAERTHQHEGAESTIGKGGTAAVEKVRTDG